MGLEEEILKALVEHQAEFSTGIGYPGAPTPEDVVRELREQGVELPELPPSELEGTINDTIEDALDKFCKLKKFIEISNSTREYVEGSYLYVCRHPNLGRFFVVIDEMQDTAVGEATYRAKFFRNEADALQDFSGSLEHYLDDHDAETIEELEKILEEKGLNVEYSI